MVAFFERGARVGMGLDAKSSGLKISILFFFFFSLELKEESASQ